MAKSNNRFQVTGCRLQMTLKAVLGLLLSFFAIDLIAAQAPTQPQMRASISTSSTGTKKNSSSLPVPRTEATPQPASKVFFALDQQAMSPTFQVNVPLVQKMLAFVVCGVTQKRTTKEAWQSLIKTGKDGDRVGIKVATEPGIIAGTHHELVEALVAELLEAGVTPEHIIVWDRRRQDLEKTGYTKIPSLQLRWTDQGSGYDPKLVFSHPIIGQLMYGDSEFKERSSSLKESLYLQDQLSNDSHYAFILSHQVDKVIDVPSLCDSWYTGVNGALANMTIGVIDNWRRFVKAPFFGAPYIAEIYKSEPIHSKVIITLMDALALQYAGGPRANPSHAMAYAMILGSSDPVAIDATALSLINEQRTIANLPKIEAEVADHIQSAEALGLGNAKNVKMIRVAK